MTISEIPNIEEQTDNVTQYVTLSDSKAELTNSEDLNDLVISKIKERIKNKSESVDEKNEINELNNLIKKAIDSFDPVEGISEEYTKLLNEIETGIKPLKILKISKKVSQVLPKQTNNLSTLEQKLAEEIERKKKIQKKGIFTYVLNNI